MNKTELKQLFDNYSSHILFIDFTPQGQRFFPREKQGNPAFQSQLQIELQLNTQNKTTINEIWEGKLEGTAIF